jgi:hypothetical protein
VATVAVLATEFYVFAGDEAKVWAVQYRAIN